MPLGGPPSATTGLTRRHLGLLLGATGLSAAAGCSLEDLDPRDPLPGPTLDAEGDPVPTLPPDADAELVLAATAAVASVARQVRRARNRFPALAGPLQPWAALHGRQLGVLDSDGGLRAEAERRGLVALGGIAAGRRAERNRLARVERDLGTSLTESAITAVSGDVARLLASLSAGQAQRLALADAPPAGGGPS